MNGTTCKTRDGFLRMLIVVVFLFQGVATASADEGENAQSALQSLSVIEQTDDYDRQNVQIYLAHGFTARLLAVMRLPETIF